MINDVMNVNIKILLNAHNGYTKFADMSKNNTEEVVNITNDTLKKKKRGRKKFHK